MARRRCGVYTVGVARWRCASGGSGRGAAIGYPRGKHASLRIAAPSAAAVALFAAIFAGIVWSQRRPAPPPRFSIADRIATEAADRPSATPLRRAFAMPATAPVSRSASPAAAIASPPTSPAVTAAPHVVTPGGAAPAAGQRPPGEVRRRALAEQIALRTGQLRATIEYGDGTRTDAAARFELDAQRRVLRLSLALTPQASQAGSGLELVLIGDRAWQRAGGGPWATASSVDGVQEQVELFLPSLAALNGAAIEQSGDGATFRWYDANTDTDVALTVDAATGTPRLLVGAGRRDRTMLTVLYTTWNAPVEIVAPTIP